MILYHVTFASNVPSIREHGLRASIGERSSSFGETRPAVYMFSTLQETYSALLNWLGDNMFDERPDDDPVVFEVRCDDAVSQEVDWEYTSYSDIPASNILSIIDLEGI